MNYGNVMLNKPIKEFNNGNKISRFTVSDFTEASDNNSRGKNNFGLEINLGHYLFKGTHDAMG